MKKQVYFISTLLVATINTSLHCSQEPKQRSQKPLQYTVLVPDIDDNIYNKRSPRNNKKPRLKRQLSNNEKNRHTSSPTNIIEKNIDPKVLVGLQELLLTMPKQQQSDTPTLLTEQCNKEESSSTPTLHDSSKDTQLVPNINNDQKESITPQTITADTIRTLLKQQEEVTPTEQSVSWTEWLTFGLWK